MKRIMMLCIKIAVFYLIMPVSFYAQDYSFQDSEARYMHPVPKADGGALILGWFANPMEIDGYKITPPKKSNGKYDLTYYLHSTDSAGNTQWVKSFSKRVMIRYATTHNNTFYLAVDSEQQDVFDGSPTRLGPSTGHYISKLSDSGKWQWVLGTRGFIRDLNVDDSGNILAIVQIEEGGKTPGGKPLVTGYSKDYVLLKVSPQGKILWEQQISGGKDLPKAQPRLSLVNQVASDPQGNVYAAGNFQAKAYIGGDDSYISTKITYGPGEVLYDAETFVAKFDAQGKLISVFKDIEKLDIVDLIDLAVDQSGDAYLTGYFSGDYIWAHKDQKPPSASKQMFKSTGREDAFLVKIKDMKEVDWIIQPEGMGNDRGESIIIGKNQIEFMFTFAQTIKVLGKTFTEKTGDSYKTDMLLLTLDLAGNLKSAVQLQGRGGERGTLYGLGEARYLYGLTFVQNNKGSYDFLIRYTGTMPGDKISQDITAHSAHLLYDLTTFKTGERVKAQVEGKWYSGEVSKTSDRHYLLKMDNSQPQYWEWVMPVYLRPMSYNPNSNTSTAKEVKSSDRSKTSFSKGDQVQVLWKGKWYNARVLELKNGKYYVKYDNYGEEWNEWVTDSRIRSR